MAEAELSQRGDGVKVFVHLTEADVELARRALHSIAVTLDDDYERDHPTTANPDVIEVVVTVE